MSGARLKYEAFRRTCAAASVVARLEALFLGHRPVLQFDFTTRKAEYLVEVAAQVVSGQLDLARLKQMPDEEVILALTSIRGIGLWTAEWMLARTLGRPRVGSRDQPGA